MIKNYDKFLTENVDNDRLFNVFLLHININKQMFNEQFYIKELLHEKLDIDSYKTLMLYQNYFKVIEYREFVATAFLEHVKNNILPKLKKLNLGIKDLIFTDIINDEIQQAKNDNFHSVKFNVSMVVNKSFFNSLLSLIEKDFYGDKPLIHSENEYNIMVNQLSDFIKNINRKKSNDISIYYKNVEIILDKLNIVETLYNRKKEYDYKDIDILVNNENFKPINFVSPPHDSKYLEVYNIEKTKTYNL